MPYQIAGIDVHKKMLAVVVADVEVEGDYHFERLKVGTSPAQLRALADWLVEREVEEVVMESTAQYWRPVWEALEQSWRPVRRTRAGASPVSGTLHLAQAQSNRGAGGRKRDFPDAERLVKRLVAQELTLSFVPDAEQRLWRTVMRRKYQITRNRVQLHNRLESLLEEAHIKLSSLVSDLLGTSARRMLQAIADGETDPAILTTLADRRLRTTATQLRDALSACATLHPVYRRLLQHARGTTIARGASRPTRSTNGATARATSCCRAAIGRSPRARRELRAADHCGSRRQRRDISITQTPRLLDGRLPRHRGERRRQLQSPLPEGQPADAARPQSKARMPP
jgi:transposase